MYPSFSACKPSISGAIRFERIPLQLALQSMTRSGADKGETDVTDSGMAHRDTASRMALVGAALVLAAAAI
jgi:hypothetical protein